MTDYFELAADIARTHHPAAETRGLLMVKPWRDIKHKSLSRQTLTFTDDEYDQLSEALRIAKNAVTESAICSRWLSESHAEYLRVWAERFEDLRLRIEER